MCADRYGSSTGDETADFQAFSTRTDTRADGVVLSVFGEIDMATAPRLTDQINAALSTTPRLLVIDLTKVTFLSSAGLSALASGQQQAAAQSTRFRVAAAGLATSRPIQLTGLDKVLDVVSTVDEAFLPV
jgi:anti-anti-sigma factor